MTNKVPNLCIIIEVLWSIKYNFISCFAVLIAKNINANVVYTIIKILINFLQIDLDIIVFLIKNINIYIAIIVIMLGVGIIISNIANFADNAV